MTEPRITVNGEARALTGVPAYMTALDFLRDLGLTGAKEGCAEGECGACSVMVARPAGADPADRTQWTAINACLVPAAALDGQEVVTAEGLGTLEALHPVQREMAARGGSQCGYCTPGFVCSMAAEYYRGDRASGEGDHEHGPNGFDLHALSGNLCRCTGYRPIRDAAWALGQPLADDPLAGRSPDRHRPPPAPGSNGPTGRSRDPTDLAEALALLADHPDATVVAGCTDWGVEVNLRGARAAYAVAVDRLPELRELEVREDDVLDRGRAHPVRGRGRPGRRRTPARRGVAAVRLAADPQRRHHRRQHRHRLADRRPATCAARAGGDGRAVVAGRRPRGAAGRLLHRLPRDRAATRAS